MFAKNEQGKVQFDLASFLNLFLVTVSTVVTIIVLHFATIVEIQKDIVQLGEQVKVNHEEILILRGTRTNAQP